MSSAETFLKTCCRFVPDIEQGTESQKFYQRYLTWCNEQNMLAVNNVNLGKAITKIFPSVLKIRCWTAKQRKHFYMGLVLIQNPALLEGGAE